MDPTATRPLGRAGLEVTALGLGGAALGNLFRAVDEGAARQTIDAALDAGIRYFDTAPFYGHGLSEHRIGEALRDRDRETIVLSTKVGRRLVPRRKGPGGALETGYVATLPFEPVYDYSYDGVMRSYESSLDRLGVDRIDVLFVHDIGERTHGAAHREQFRIAMGGGFRALDELRRAGDVRAVGLGVNECEVCVEALAVADFDCLLLAGRYTLLEQGALDALLPICESRGVSVVIGGPYNSGLLAAEPGSDATYDYAAAPPDVVAKARTLRLACDEFGVALKAAALQFPLHHPAVSAVIPGARSPQEALENARMFRSEIPTELYVALRERGLLREDAPLPA
jgi:D-threo-aldose 1-dehydrogenase